MSTLQGIGEADVGEDVSTIVGAADIVVLMEAGGDGLSSPFSVGMLNDGAVGDTDPLLSDNEFLPSPPSLVNGVVAPLAVTDMAGVSGGLTPPGLDG